MRCHICDYDPTKHPTAYSTSVHHRPNDRKVSVFIDQKTKEPICSDCDAVIKRTVKKQH